MAPNDAGDPRRPAQPGLSRRLILAVRLLFLIMAGGAVLAGLALGLAPGTAGETATRYVCPMHPEVRAAAPGGCPICQMALERETRAPAGAVPGGQMPGMADVIAVENVRKHKILDFVRRRSLLPNLREQRGPASIGDDGVLTAVLYDDQIDALSARERGTFWLAAAPRASVSVIRTADPAVRWDRSTSALRFRLLPDDRSAPPHAAGAAPRLRPGDAGWLELEHKAREVVAVPASAILPSPEGPYVLAWAGGRRFEKRPIEVGETFLKQGFAVVLSGLRPQERVISRAAFFVDADRRLGSRGDGDGEGISNPTSEGSWGVP